MVLKNDNACMGTSAMKHSGKFYVLWCLQDYFPDISASIQNETDPGGDL